MPTLAYGLNITKHPKLAPAVLPLTKRKRIFDEEDDDDGISNDAEKIETFDGLSANPDPATNILNTSTSKSPSGSNRKRPNVSQQSDLSSAHTAAKHIKTAQAIDSNVYDYDAVYDSLHAKPSASTALSVTKEPKYMSNLLAAAEIRKRNQLRAKEKMLLKERETEGDEFADKEKFVTGAYKAQQKEIARMEEEEAKREVVEEDKRKSGGGMISLYKGILDKNEEKHAEIVKAIEESKGRKVQSDGAQAEQDADSIEAELAKTKGAVMNEDGQVVDKRQLLRAGLNVASKPRTELLSTSLSASSTAMHAATNLPAGRSNRTGGNQAQRERQTKVLQDQLEEQARKAQEEEMAKKRTMEEGLKSRKTDEDIGSARERYLARKKEAEEA